MVGFYSYFDLAGSEQELSFVPPLILVPLLLWLNGRNSPPSVRLLCGATALAVLIAFIAGIGAEETSLDLYFGANLGLFVGVNLGLFVVALTCQSLNLENAPSSLPPYFRGWRLVALCVAIVPAAYVWPDNFEVAFELSSIWIMLVFVVTYSGDTIRSITIVAAATSISLALSIWSGWGGIDAYGSELGLFYYEPTDSMVFSASFTSRDMLSALLAIAAGRVLREAEISNWQGRRYLSAALFGLMFTAFWDVRVLVEDKLVELDSTPMLFALLAFSFGLVQARAAMIIATIFGALSFILILPNPSDVVQTGLNFVLGRLAHAQEPLEVIVQSSVSVDGPGWSVVATDWFNLSISIPPDIVVQLCIAAWFGESTRRRLLAKRELDGVADSSNATPRANEPAS